MEEWRRKRLECEQVAKLATETGELEMVDIMVSKVAAEKGKISQVGDNRRKKKRKLEVLVNWGERNEVTILSQMMGRVLTMVETWVVEDL